MTFPEMTNLERKDYLTDLIAENDKVKAYLESEEQRLRTDGDFYQSIGDDKAATRNWDNAKALLPLIDTIKRTAGLLDELKES